MDKEKMDFSESDCPLRVVKKLIKEIIPKAYEVDDTY
jgi:hypothetical protein